VVFRIINMANLYALFFAILTAKTNQDGVKHLRKILSLPFLTEVYSEAESPDEKQLASVMLVAIALHTPDSMRKKEARDAMYIIPIIREGIIHCEDVNGALKELRKREDKRNFWEFTFIKSLLWLIENFECEGRPVLIEADTADTALNEGFRHFKDTFFMRHFIRYFSATKNTKYLATPLQLFLNITSDTYDKFKMLREEEEEEEEEEEQEEEEDICQRSGCPGCIMCTNLLRCFKKEHKIRVDHIRAVLQTKLSLEENESVRKSIQDMLDKLSVLDKKVRRLS
jgi:hypothetical protein